MAGIDSNEDSTRDYCFRLLYWAVRRFNVLAERTACRD
jgi:hypothetical protein